MTLAELAYSILQKPAVVMVMCMHIDAAKAMAAVRLHPLLTHKAGHSSFKGDGGRCQIPGSETEASGLISVRRTALITKGKKSQV